MVSPHPIQKYATFSRHFFPRLLSPGPHLPEEVKKWPWAVPTFYIHDGLGDFSLYILGKVLKVHLLRLYLAMGAIYSY